MNGIVTQISANRPDGSCLFSI